MGDFRYVIKQGSWVITCSVCVPDKSLTNLRSLPLSVKSYVYNMDHYSCHYVFISVLTEIPCLLLVEILVF